MTPLPPGLQAHRTSLSWMRLGFTAAVAAALALRMGVVHRDPVYLIAGTLLLGVLVLALVTARRRGRDATVGAPEHHAALPRTAWYISLLAALGGLTVIIGVFTEPL